MCVCVCTCREKPDVGQRLSKSSLSNEHPLKLTRSWLEQGGCRDFACETYEACHALVTGLLHFLEIGRNDVKPKSLELLQSRLSKLSEDRKR